MRVGYFDTSVLVAIAFDEPGADRVVDAVRTLDVALSATLLESEFLAAAQREGLRREAKRLLGPIRWVFPERRLTRELEAVLDTGYLRGADLHHIATALYLFPKPGEAYFVTLDQRQEHAARQLGFQVLKQLMRGE